MSGRPTKIDLAEAGSGESDWARVDGLSDADIEAAIASDPDTWSPSPDELAEAMSFRYVIYRDEAGKFRWRLVGSDGEVVAEAGGGFADREAVKAAVRVLKRAVLKADAKAA